MNKLISSVGLSMYRHAILFFLSKKDSLTIYLVDLQCECSILGSCKSRILSSRSKYELILIWFSWYMLLRESFKKGYTGSHFFSKKTRTHFYV